MKARTERWTEERKRRLRWWTLVALSLSLLVVIVEDTIINVAMPTLQRELGASTSSLQWIVDAYILVFAGLLLTMGTLGDRFGRKRGLQVGLLVFTAGSVFAAMSGSTTELIGARVVMGIGGALIMPSTLAVLVDVFSKGERVRAIAIWTGVASLGIPLGPLVGGWLIERFWWGSVFLVNVPLVAITLVMGWFLVPESRDPAPPRTDWVGAGLSMAGLGALLAGIIEGPGRGWTDPLVLSFFGGAAALGVLFVAYELKAARPMLDVRLFRRPAFAAATGSIALASLALAGLVFNLTQYFQLVRGYSPFQAGLRTIALAIGFGLGGQLAQRVGARLGARPAIVGGLVVAGGLLSVFSSFGATTPYWLIAAALALTGAAFAMVLIPSTDAIVAGMPEEQAGVGSAVNDLSRQLGAALGIAVLGSLMSGTYASAVAGVTGLPAGATAGARESLAAALGVAARLGEPAGAALRQAATVGFLDGFGVAMLAGAGVLLAAAFGIHRALRPRAAATDEVLALEGQLEAA